MTAHCLVLLLFLMPQTGHGATVYRVGGNAGSSNIHLSWTELATGFGGDWKSLNMDERIEPIFLKPDRNFALEALDGGRPPLVRKQTINFLAWVSDPIVNSTVDGDKTTGFAEDYLIAERQFPRFLFDLGGRFPINRVVFYPRPEHQDRFVENFRVYVFDGDPRLLDGGNFLVQWNQPVPEIRYRRPGRLFQGRAVLHRQAFAQRPAAVGDRRVVDLRRRIHARGPVHFANPGSGIDRHSR